MRKMEEKNKLPYYSPDGRYKEVYNEFSQKWESYVKDNRGRWLPQF